MTLSIVIVSHNTRADLENCVRSLADAPPALPHDITVVDNASSDGSAEAVARGWPLVTVIPLQTNRGFAAANNVGIRATAGELVLLLNSDTIVPPGAIDRLAGRVLQVPGVAIAGPRIVDGSGRPELSFGRMISPLVELGQKTILTLYDRQFGPVSRWIEGATRREQFVEWVSGACLLVRREAADAVGLLDERYFLYAEDVDFCAAVRARGHRVLFTPAAEITHLRGRSRAAAPGAANAAYRKSHMAFYEKHHPRWAPFLRAYLRLKRAAD